MGETEAGVAVGGHRAKSRAPVAGLRWLGRDPGASPRAVPCRLGCGASARSHRVAPPRPAGGAGAVPDRAGHELGNAARRLHLPAQAAARPAGSVPRTRSLSRALQYGPDALRASPARRLPSLDGRAATHLRPNPERRDRGRSARHPGGKVTVAKEVARLLGEIRSPDAY